jgi:hypothetical protein
VHTAFPAARQRVRPVSHVRSTVITTGLAALRARGLFDDWAASLDAASRDTIATTIAGVWLPIDLVMTHYRACEALQLTHDEAVSIGMSVGVRIHENLLLTLKRLATEVGMTPWLVGAQYERLWSRSFDGGGFRITREGPKDAIIELLQVPMAEFSYFRGAFCGLNLVGMNLFCTKAYVRVVNGSCVGHGFAIRVSWA